MKNIVLFASGSGSNVENIYNYFKGNSSVNIALVLTNNKDAYVIERAKRLGIECVIFNREQFYKTNFVLDIIREHKADLIVLAGFLWLVPENLIKEYPNKIVNIHPALLPKYGGKGMYGDNVHKAVVEAGEKKSGITIHYVNANYDEGDIIFQAETDINPGDTYKKVADKVHKLEYEYFPKVIESLIQ